MKRRSKAAQVAYPAILGALAVVVVYIAAVAPTGRWGIVAAAGLLPAAAVISVGLKAGFLCWAGASALSFLLSPDKFCAVLFAALFGLYPMVKSLTEGLRKKAAGVPAEAGLFQRSLYGGLFDHVGGAGGLPAAGAGQLGVGAVSGGKRGVFGL